MELNINVNEFLQEMEFNLDSSHSAEDEKLENENQLPESLRPYFEVVDEDREYAIAQCLLCVKKKAKNSKYKGFKNSLFNWEAHLSCKHPKECRKYREAKAEEAVLKRQTTAIVSVHQPRKVEQEQKSRSRR